MAAEEEEIFLLECSEGTGTINTEVTLVMAMVMEQDRVAKT